MKVVRAPPAPDTREPSRAAEKRMVASEAGIPSTVIVIGWRAPSTADPDWFAVKRLGEVLGGTAGARLTDSLVKTAGVASNVNVSLADSAGPNLLLAELVMAPGKDPAQAESLVYQEIEKIGRDGVPKEEMERVATDARRRRTFQLVTTIVRAQVLAGMTAIARADDINEWEPRDRRVTSEDVKRVARQYLAPANRTVITVAPVAKQ